MLVSVPLMRPILPQAEDLIPYLKRIDSNRSYSNFGPLHDDFLARLLQIQHQLDGAEIFGVLTANATTGLEMAIAALDLPLGSRVALPALTFPATASAIQRCGHIPVAFDVDPSSWLLTPSQVPTDGIDAVVPVAAFGKPQDAQAWAVWSKDKGIPVIVDAAAAFGGQQTAPGVTVVFSLHATKTLSSAEGGVVFSRDPMLVSRLRAMTNFGIGLNGPALVGNAKMSEYHAAVGLAHLALWPAQMALRYELLERYRDQLVSAVGSVFDFQEGVGSFAPSVLPIRLNSASLRDQLEQSCAHAGVQTRRWYQPLIQHQPMLGAIEAEQGTPNAEFLSTTLLGLPFYPDMTEMQLGIVVAQVLAL